MNEDARQKYRPAPKPGEMKCPKCGSEMKPSLANPKVSVCTAGHAVGRMKI